MSKTTLEQLDEELAKIDRPGSFCVRGSAPTVLPGLEVQDLGPVALPLTPQQAKQLKKCCVQAPYGKGEQTIVDTSVRRVWRVAPDHFSLTNPDWQRFLQETVSKVQEALGLEQQNLESHLYDLLLYERGSFFLPHRDGEKLKRMVATLVIVLPSSHEGGELVVRHEGQEQTIDFASASNSAFQIQYAAFYADCEHEVRPLKKGYRLCLVYNLTLAKGKQGLTAPRQSEHIAKISSLLREWSEEPSALKLVITLDHQYTKDGLTWDTLKGADRAKADVLSEAARQAGCTAYLTLLTFHESGSAEYAGGGHQRGYRRRGSWYDDDEEDEDDGSQYEMGEVFESSLTAEHLVDRDNKPGPLAELDVEEEDLLDPDALTAVDPEEEFEGYTGNAGMTLDRWYRHAALVLWPEKRHFEILCERDSRNAVPMLEDLVRQWRHASAKEAPALKTQCLDLANAILSRWRENRHAGLHYAKQETSALLKVLLPLEEAKLVRTFLGEVMLKDVSLEPGKSLAAACGKYGWRTFQPELVALLQATTPAAFPRDVRVVEQLCLAEARKEQGWEELCRLLADKMVGALTTLDAAPSHDWQAQSVNRGEALAGLARALLASGQWETLGRVVAHARGLPQKYPLESAHLKALESLAPWLKKKVKKPCAELSQWVAFVRKEFEALTARVPEPPADFRREAAVTCKCQDCAELNRFLNDPSEKVHRFPRRQDLRNHLENNIRQHRCDLDLTTERTRSPHTLVCTKNTKSYEERLKKYHHDEKHLALIRTLEASLPG